MRKVIAVTFEVHQAQVQTKAFKEVVRRGLFIICYSPCIQNVVVARELLCSHFKLLVII